MPLQNRATPLGDVVEHAARGLVYANRGCLHDAKGAIRCRYNGKRWIACRLEFKGRRRHPLMRPGRFTELFFLDEATAFAAGHRPCAECRREDYRRFTEIWRSHYPDVSADMIDARLHAERVDPATHAQRHHSARVKDLPDGAYVFVDGAAWMLLGAEILKWSPGGYERRVRRPAGDVTLVTPPSLVEVLRAGWEGGVPLLHPSAR